MDKEAVKCRGPMAHAFNQIGVWLPFPNLSYVLGTDAYRGRPDGEYRTREGHVADVEFKAHVGSVYFGNPNDPKDTRGWHKAQREWFHHVCVERSSVPYYLVIWCYPEAKDNRFDSKKSSFFVVTPGEFLELEKQIFDIQPDKPRRTVAILKNSDRILKYRHVSMEDVFGHQMFKTAEDAASFIDTHCRRRTH